MSKKARNANRLSKKQFNEKVHVLRDIDESLRHVESTQLEMGRRIIDNISATESIDEIIRTERAKSGIENEWTASDVIDHLLSPVNVHDLDSPQYGNSYFDIWPQDQMHDRQALIFRDTPEEHFHLTKRMVIDLSTVARAKGYRCYVGRETIGRLDSTRDNFIIGAFRCASTGTSNHGIYVRLCVALELDNRDRAKALLDMSPATWDAFITDNDVLHDTDLSFHFNNQGAIGRVQMSDMPHWAGARAFEKVWRSAMHYSEIAYDAVDYNRDPIDAWGPDKSRSMSRGLTIYGLKTIRSLMNTTEVLMDPDQVMALPDFDSWDDLMFQARETRLPFESIFLDMEGPASGRVIHPMPQPFDTAEDQVDIPHDLYLSGALVQTVKGALAISPYGMVADKPSERFISSRELYIPMGMVIVSEMAIETRGLMIAGIVGEAGLSADTVMCDPYLVNESLPKPSGLTFYTLQDADRKVCTNQDSPPTPDYVVGPRTRFFTTQARGLLEATRVILRALWLLEMSNVEIVDAPVTRQMRRSAQRQQGQIAMTVHIASNRKQYLPRDADTETGEERHVEYSHRFRVRGHPAHFPLGTRMADSRPDMVRPCARCGKCRRIYVPPYIKGPEEKPLILKSLKKDPLP